MTRFRVSYPDAMGQLVSLNGHRVSTFSQRVPPFRVWAVPVTLHELFGDIDQILAARLANRDSTLFGRHAQNCVDDGEVSKLHQ